MRFCTAQPGAAGRSIAEMHGRKVFLRGAEQPLVTDIIHPDGPADLYVRPGDLRLADPGSPGIEVHVTAVQRTGPIVRASAEVLANGTGVSIELPHLHHDAARFQAGATAPAEDDAVLRIPASGFGSCAPDYGGSGTDRRRIARAHPRLAWISTAPAPRVACHHRVRYP